MLCRKNPSFLRCIHDWIFSWPANRLYAILSYPSSPAHPGYKIPPLLPELCLEMYGSRHGFKIWSMFSVSCKSKYRFGKQTSHLFTTSNLKVVRTHKSEKTSHVYIWQYMKFFYVLQLSDVLSDEWLLQQCSRAKRWKEVFYWKNVFEVLDSSNMFFLCSTVSGIIWQNIFFIIWVICCKICLLRMLFIVSGSATL